MRIALFCATRRGLRFLQTLAALAPSTELIVFSFAEEAWEPPFLEEIRQAAHAVGAQFYESKQVGAGRWQSLWEAAPVDLMFAVSWRYVIPAQVFRRARLGAYVFHDSLLPEYRGFSPTVWSIINGEDHTGVTLFEMIEDYDAGAIIGQQRVPIGPDDTITLVIERVTDAYLDLLRLHFAVLMAGAAPRFPQDESRATYTCKLLPGDFLIDWAWPTQRIYNLIRAATMPYAGAYCYLEGQRLRVWEAQRIVNSKRFIGRVPGRVVEFTPGEGAIVLTGDGALRLLRVQKDDYPVGAAGDVLDRLSITLTSRP